MIKQKEFNSLLELNNFKKYNKIKVISIETKKVVYDTGLPFMNGSTFISEKDVLNLFYEEINNTNE